MVSRTILREKLLAKDPSLVVAEASNGKDYRENHADVDYDLISLDLNMPGESGEDLLDFIKSQKPESNVVILSANVQRPVRERIESKNADFMAKPITDEIIDDYIRRLHQ